MGPGLCTGLVCLFAAPYLGHGGVHSILKPWSLVREEIVPARDFTCALVSLPDQWLWSLVWDETTCAHAYNIWKWHPTQWTAARQCCKQLCGFGATKTLSGCIAPCWDKHQFCDKMMMSSWAVFKLSLFHEVVWTRKEENGNFVTAHFRVQLSSMWLLGTYMSLADHKGTQRGRLGA